jgi:hypothetical protein
LIRLISLRTNPRGFITPPSSRPGTPNESTGVADFEEKFDPAAPIVKPENSILLSIADVPLYLDKALLALGLHTEARTSFITYIISSLPISD